MHEQQTGVTKKPSTSYSFILIPKHSVWKAAGLDCHFLCSPSPNKSGAILQRYITFRFSAEYIEIGQRKSYIAQLECTP